MYESYYGLKEKPFKLLPDPDYLYMSEGHENAYTHLEYAIAEQKGFVVITGEIGSGKTTLINYLLSRIPQDIQVGLVYNTYVSPNQFIKMVCKEFELETEGMDKAEMMDLFHSFLLRQFTQNKRVVLIVDEAQNLLPKTMEEIRMLSNLESEKHHLIQMVLSGQPELKQKLQRKDLEQFTQRVTVHCHLSGLNEEEVGQYVRYRLRVAGGENLNLFDNEALEVIARYSHGIPRLINILCDNALVYGYADDLQVIDRQVIENVIKAREEGGIFCETGEEKAAALQTTIGKDLEGRLQVMERRIRLLEDVVSNMHQSLETVVSSRNGRDTLVLELFKMLKESMEGRVNTLMQVAQLRKTVKPLEENPFRAKGSKP